MNSENKQKRQQKPRNRQRKQRTKILAHPAISDKLPRKRLPQSMTKALQQIIDPERMSEAIMIPDRSPAPRAVRRFYTKFSLSAASPGCSTGFTMAVYPSLDVPIAYTGSATLIPAAPGPLAIEGQIEVNDLNVITSSAFLATSTNDSKAVFSLRDITHTATYPGMYLNNTGVTAQSLMVAFDSSASNTQSPYKIQVFTALTADVAWTSRGTVSVGQGLNPTIDLSTYTFDHLAFFCQQGNKFHRTKITLVGNATTLMQLTTQNAIDLGQGRVVNTLQESVGGRLTAMSLFVQNTSPEIANGGVITIGRVNKELNPFKGIPNIINGSRTGDIYQGPLAHGGYTWWLPRENNSRQYLDLAEAKKNLSEEPYLLCNVEGWLNGANVSSVQITVCYVVEFAIHSQLYEKRTPPLVTSKWDQLYSILSAMPAASCNPEHKEIFSEYLKKAKNVIDGVTDHYQKYKNEYNMAFEALLGVLAAL